MGYERQRPEPAQESEGEKTMTSLERINQLTQERSQLYRLQEGPRAPPSHHGSKGESAGSGSWKAATP